MQNWEIIHVQQQQEQHSKSRDPTPPIWCVRCSPSCTLLRSSFFSTFSISIFFVCLSLSLCVCVCGYRRLFLLLNLFRFSSLSTSASISLQRTLETGPLLLPGKCSGCRPQLLYIAQQMHISRPRKKRKNLYRRLAGSIWKRETSFSLMPHATMIESIVNIFLLGPAALSTHASCSDLYIFDTPSPSFALNHIIDTNAHCVHVGQQSWSAGCAPCIPKHTHYRELL